jgi:hypothetical protein
VAANAGTKMTDPKTGTSYLLNPNRRLMTGSLESLPGGRTAVLGQFDASGEVEIAIWVSSAGGRHNLGVATNVDQGFVLIGGGAFADYGTGAGAILTESRPVNDYNFSTWVGSSKDHHVESYHTLYVYAIGLRLKNISSTTLKNYLTVNSNTSAYVAHPNTSVSVPTGYKLIGGGARVNWSGQGNLLVDSHPNTTLTTWSVASKDHVNSSPATIEAYAIGLNPIIPGFGEIEVALQTAQSSTTQKGVTTATLNVEQTSVLSCIGADSYSDATGRLLTAMYPADGNSRTVYARTKDHVFASPGYVIVKAIKLKKKI